MIETQKHETRLRLHATACADTPNFFDVLLITTGVANGWHFSEHVLQNSLPLWEGCECFIDHITPPAVKSVRDLCGVFYDIVWDQSAQGIRAKLKTLGPSGPLAAQLGQEWLAQPEPRPAIGFSVDISLLADAAHPLQGATREVLEITRAYSCDLVFEPARGGTFLRALHTVDADSIPINTIQVLSHRKELSMNPTQQPIPLLPATLTNSASTAAQELESTRTLLQGAQATQLTTELEQTRAMRAQMCALLLEQTLGASHLPASVQSRLKKQFANKVFDAAELQTAIDDARVMVSELTGGASVAGLRAVVSGMYNSDDHLRLAVDDLLGIERDPKEANVQVARLSGIRELYMGMQGDYDLYGGYYPDRARFQHTTTTFAGLVKNALNKAIVRHWNQIGRAGYDWWQKIVHIEHFDSLNQITWVIFGTVSALPTVAEGAEYTELKIADSPETASFTKYGGYIGITLEAIDRDDTRKLRLAPRELANAGIRNISSLVAAIFTNNSGVGPTLADGGALFNNTAVTTAGGHANLLTTALGTDYAAWDAAAKAMYDQPMLVANESGYYGTGKKLAIDPRYALVPRALRAQAEALFMPRWESVVDGISSAGGPSYGGHVVPVVVPEWTDATDWAAVADPLLVPGICIGERFGLLPEVFIAGDERDPAMFSNDESRIKVRHFIAVGVADFRPLHKNNVAA